MNKIKTFCKQRYEDIQKRPVLIVLGLIYAMALLYRYNYLQGENVSGFDRSISLSLLMGLDYSSRIKGIYIFNGVLIPIATMILTVVFSALFQKKEKAWNAFKTISFLSAVPLLVGYISKYANSEATAVALNSLIDYLVIFLFFFLVLIFFDNEESLSETSIYQYFILLILGSLSFKQYLPEETEVINHYVWFLIMNGAVPTILTLIIILALKTKKIDLERFFHVGIMTTWIPFMTRIIIEICYTLINNGYFIGNIQRITVLITIVYLIILIALFMKNILPSWFVKCGYIGALMSVSSLIYYSNYYQGLSLSSPEVLYEIANFSSGIDTYNYGKLPILDYFSAHALQDVVPRLLSAFLNHEYYYLYSGSFTWKFLFEGIAIVFFYQLLKEFLDEPVAVIFTLLVPCSVTGVFVSSFCYLPIITSMILYRKRSWFYYFTWWLSLAISAFWLYDHGMSIGIACIIVISVLTLLKKLDLKFSRIIISGLITGGSFFALCCMYCLMHDIEIVSRLKEWLSLSVGSSSTWAVAQIGDATTIGYFICYVFVPFMTFGMLFFLLKDVIKTYSEKIFIPLVLTLTVILYINRTIVYHTLSTCLGTTGVTLNYFPILLVFFIAYLCWKKKDSLVKRTRIISMAFIICMYVIGTCVTGINPDINSSYVNQADTYAEQLTIEKDTTEYEGQNRTYLDESTTKLVNDFSGIFDTLLTEEQTYVDFADVTGLYGLVGRERPSYVSQLPSLLSDIYSQECFLEGLETEYDAPLALVGNSSESLVCQMNGTTHAIRYYKIAEYIYRNYRPFVSYSIYTIWCRNDDYEQMKEKLESSNLLNDEIQQIDYGFDAGYYMADEEGENEFTYDNVLSHDHNYENLAYIWANDDEYQSVNNTVLEECTKVSDTRYTFSGSSKYRKENDCGNYLLLECEAGEAGTMQIILRNGNDDSTRYQYTINLSAGINKYMIRLSQDSFWYAYDINDIEFQTDGNIAIHTVHILEGD